jgi:1-pyrroline-5-carboxylate dehydrogenase
MNNDFFVVPPAVNEPVYAYAPGSPERQKLTDAVAEVNKNKYDIAMIINGKEVRTDNKVNIVPPHNHKHVIGTYSKGDGTHVKMAIEAALAAKKDWENMPWNERAAIFLKAANLIAGPYRYKMNAATMVGQSKNPFQSEIDAVAELVDFFRFNVKFMTELYAQQPISNPSTWNRTELRPLEGYVLAITPFNFTSIGGNLPTAPALMGNTVVWKVAEKQAYSAHLIMRILMEAGLPDGVINMIFVPGSEIGKTVFSHPEFAGVHFTGSTSVFNNIWKTIGNNMDMYKAYPRIVGETGGKNFIVMHPSAKIEQLATAIIRGGFEYQGQKCSAASRVYIPQSHWADLRKLIETEMKTVKMGPVEDFSNFVNAVIDEKSFDNLAGYIDRAKKSPDCEIIVGGKYDKSVGYFIEPTIILTSDPNYETMREELFGPVVTIYIYPDVKFEETLHLVNKTSGYALTGSIFSIDRKAIELADSILRHAAGNFYINDKPTGAVVGQQPFGGARASGTDDKAGSALNLLRWVSARTIKENFLPDTNYRYPFLG